MTITFFLKYIFKKGNLALLRKYIGTFLVGLYNFGVINLGAVGISVNILLFFCLPKFLLMLIIQNIKILDIL